MFEEILREFDENIGFSKENLAKKLNTSESLIEDSINHLIRLGYINKSESLSNCQVSCGSCPYSKACGKDLVTFYNISSKGRKYLYNKN